MDNEREYRYSASGVTRVLIYGNGLETVTDEWSALAGLVKCTSYSTSEREGFAKAMAIAWAALADDENRAIVEA